MRAADSESGAEVPATLWDALLYDAVDSLQTLQVHSPADGVMSTFRGKSAKEDVAEFRRELVRQLKAKSRDRRVFRGTSNAFLIFGSANVSSSWSMRFRDADVDIDVRTVRVTVSPDRADNEA
jgi:hypothetical protein